MLFFIEIVLAIVVASIIVPFVMAVIGVIIDHW